VALIGIQEKLKDTFNATITHFLKLDIESQIKYEFVLQCSFIFPNPTQSHISEIQHH